MPRSGAGAVAQDGACNFEFSDISKMAPKGGGGGCIAAKDVVQDTSPTQLRRPGGQMPFSSERHGPIQPDPLLSPRGPPGCSSR